jgi:hypothetical protein
MVSIIGKDKTGDPYADHKLNLSTTEEHLCSIIVV